MYYTEFHKTTLRHTFILLLKQELRIDEMFHKACVPQGNIFWQ